MSANNSAATPAQIAFVNAVSARLNFPVTVTSWGRTPYEQAAAMLAKHAAAGGGAAGDKELHDTYAADRSIDTLLSLSPRNATTWGNWIAKYGMTLSRHLGGRAVDFRTRDLTASQISALSKAITAAGGRPLYETNPPHMHADIDRGVGATVAAVAKSTVLPLALFTGMAWFARGQGWI